MKNYKKIGVLVGLLLVGFLAILAFNPSQVSAACVPHASKQCITNISYWYNSCGVLEEISKNCNTTGQVCKSGECVTVAPSPTLPSTPSTSQNQKDQNLSISLFASAPNTPLQLQKNIETTNNSTVQFLLVVKNISSRSINNTMVKMDLLPNMQAQNDVTLNGVPLNQSVASGINLNTIDPDNSHVISFSVLLTPENAQAAFPVVAHITSANVTQDSDYVMLNVAPPISETSTLAPTTTTTTTTQQITTTPTVTAESFLNSIKKTWYIWVIILLALAVIFFVIFRKLSSDI